MKSHFFSIAFHVPGNNSLVREANIALENEENDSDLEALAEEFQFDFLSSSDEDPADGRSLRPPTPSPQVDKTRAKRLREHEEEEENQLSDSEGDNKENQVENSAQTMSDNNTSQIGVFFRRVRFKPEPKPIENPNINLRPSSP